MSRWHRHWIETEDHQLQFYWGVKRVEWIAKKLERSPWGVVHRARALNLGPFERGNISMRRFAEISGFAQAAILRAARRAGIALHRATPGTTLTPRPHRRWAITDDQQEALIEELFRSSSTHVYADDVGAARSTKGKWGVGKKPKECLRCGTSERPHCARGLCTSCYNRPFKQKARMLQAKGTASNKEP